MRTIWPFTVTTRTTEVAWKSYVNREWGREPIAILSYLLAAVVVRILAQNPSTLDEEGIHVQGPPTLNLIKLYAIRPKANVTTP